jgi:lactoylglutathione lyase
MIFHMTDSRKLPSRISVIVLGVTDVATSVTFYRNQMGLEVKGQQESLAFFAVGDTTLMLNGNLRRPDGPLAGAAEIVFGVESVTATHELLRERGCVFTNQPREVAPGSWATTLCDPDGHYLTVFGPQ